MGLVVTERQLTTVREPSLRDVSEELIVVYGTDYGVHSPTWISRFTDMTRQATAYRDRRILLLRSSLRTENVRACQSQGNAIKSPFRASLKLFGMSRTQTLSLAGEGPSDCSNCGSRSYDLHAESCDLCDQIFCDWCMWEHPKHPEVKPAHSVSGMTKKRCA